MSETGLEQYFAEVRWTIDDIKTLRPSWTDEQCSDFFWDNEGTIQDRLTELGWEIIEMLLP